jgi:hypothetical protein
MRKDMPSDSGDRPRTTAKGYTLATLAQIAEVVAAVAVVVSLVYVGRELDSNTAAIRGASLQEATISSSASLLNVATDPSLARIMLAGRQSLSRLDEVEAFRYHTFSRQFWMLMQSVYLQHELGTIEPRGWAVYGRIICDAWAVPGTREAWPAHRHLMDEGFVALVESCP